MYKKYSKRIVLIIVILLTMYNVINYLFNKERLSKYSSLDKFMKHNTSSKANYNSELNLYFIVTPVDCQCLNYIITTDFIETIKSIFREKNTIISINYIVSGDFRLDELEYYLLPIKNTINCYIDRNNNAKTFVFKNFKTFRTPLLLILDSNGTTKYWQEFRSDIDSNEIFYNFFKLLEAIA